MSDIYLAKSDLTGAVYAVRGKSKSNVTDFVKELIDIETSKLQAQLAAVTDERDRLREILESARGIDFDTGYIVPLDGKWHGVMLFQYSKTGKELERTFDTKWEAIAYVRGEEVS